jgi:predicted N-acetyltransferase YhbS
MEFSLDLRYQGGGKYANGSPVEDDSSGVGRRLGERLLCELEALGASFITGYIVAGCEERFYQSLGFRENEGHVVYYIDKRHYVKREP